MTERPQSIEAFREVVRKSLREIKLQLHSIEREFYGNRKRKEEEITIALQAGKTLLEVVRLNSIYTNGHLEYILKKVSTPKGNLEHAESLDIFKEHIEKIFDYVPSRFQEIVKMLYTLRKHMERYCVSFGETKGEPCLDTVDNYERLRHECRRVVDFNLEYISKMMTCFRTKGLDMPMFSLPSKEIARRTDCTHIPILLVFPEACENINNSLQAILRWLKADEDYADYIKQDILDLEKTIELQLKIVRGGQQNVFHLEYQVKHSKREIDYLEKELMKLTNRQKEFRKEETAIVRAMREAESDIDFKLYQQDELKQKALNLETSFAADIQKLAEEVSYIRTDLLPNLRYKMEAFQEKKAWLVDKTSRLKQYRHDLDSYQTELAKGLEEKRAAEKDLEKMKSGLQKLKDILIYKTSPSAMKKIYLNMPIENKHKEVVKKEKLKTKSGNHHLMLKLQIMLET